MSARAVAVIRPAPTMIAHAGLDALAVSPDSTAVAVASSGATLLPQDGLDALRRLLLPLADLVTPNLAEARGAFEDPAFVARYARLRLDLYDLGSSFERFAKVLRSGGELGADVSMLKIFTTELYQRITGQHWD